MPNRSGDNHELARGFPVADYRILEAKKDAAEIAGFIRRRFQERYLSPITEIPAENRSGFTIVAIGCLMIEALESFRAGLKDTKEKGAGLTCFRECFKRHPQFSALKDRAEEFYAHVRCGILHQAETTGGWRIWRNAGFGVFDSENTIVDAEVFFQAVGETLESYLAELARSDWESSVWVFARQKLDQICKNCTRRPRPPSSTSNFFQQLAYLKALLDDEPLASLLTDVQRSFPDLAFIPRQTHKSTAVLELALADDGRIACAPNPRIEVGIFGERQTEAICHELLHFKLATLGYAKVCLNYLPADEPSRNRVRHEINLIEHEIMLPNFEALGFDPNLFLVSPAPLPLELSPFAQAAVDRDPETWSSRVVAYFRATEWGKNLKWARLINGKWQPFLG